MKNKFNSLLAVLLMASSLSTSIYASSQKDGGEEDARESVSRLSSSSSSEGIARPRIAAADMAADIFEETPLEPLSRPMMKQIGQSEMSQHFFERITVQQYEGQGTFAQRYFSRKGYADKQSNQILDLIGVYSSEPELEKAIVHRLNPVRFVQDSGFNGFRRLDSDLIVDIFYFLSWRERVSVQGVCKEFREIVSAKGFELGVSNKYRIKAKLRAERQIRNRALYFSSVNAG